MTLETDVQSSAPGKLVTLFQLDLTSLGGTVQYFTPSVKVGGSVSFDGQVYTTAPVQAEGFEVTSTGEQPRPTLRIGNVTRAATALVIEFEDLVGAILLRIRTFAHHLDGEADEDPTAIIDTQVWRVMQKMHHNKVFVEWALGSPLDHDAAQIPKRQIVPEYCDAKYRRWSAALGDFIYDTTTQACPFTDETKAFDINDQPTTLANDRASKTLNCCKVRFGANAALPFMGEPAIGKVR